MLAMDTKHRAVHWAVVGQGSLNHCPAAPRDVFRLAVVVNAASVICIHNHPSGDPTPSEDDRLLLQRLQDGGEILGVHILDAIIVTPDRLRYFSFKEAGLLHGPD